MHLFGLGGGEFIVIAIALIFVLGPQKLLDLGKNAGEIAGEFRDVPAEFKKGMEEGEINAKARNAKQMEDIDSE